MRPTVQNSINGVESCSLSPSDGVAALTGAISTRQNVSSALQDVPLSGLPNGAQLVATLSQSMQDSIRADQYYSRWMEEFTSSGDNCGSNPAGDSNFNAGQTASLQAVNDKDAFLALWNPVAHIYSQRTYTNLEM